MPRILYTLGGLGAVVAALSIHGSPLAFIDLTSILLVLVGGTLFCAAQNGFLVFFHALGVGDEAQDAAELHAQICVLQSARNAFCGTAGLGFTIGLIGMLQNLEDPAKIGPAMAVCLLTVLYGLFVSEVIVATRIPALMGRLHDRGHVEPKPPLPSDGARAALTLLIAVSAQLALFGGLTVALL